jgi:hypothetical protein
MGAEGGDKVFVEVEEVTVTPMMLAWKLRIVGLAGRVSATIVKLRLAVPPQFTVQMTLPLGPLQEDKEKAANKKTRRRALLRFIKHPTTD